MSVSKAVLEHSPATVTHLSMVQLNTCNRDSIPARLKTFVIWPLTENIFQLFHSFESGCYFLFCYNHIFSKFFSITPCVISFLPPCPNTSLR